LQGKNFDEKRFDAEFKVADDRDAGNALKTNKERLYKQNVTRCVQISDIAINNFDKRQNELFDKIMRITFLVLSPGCTKPTTDEMFMNMAYTMSVKSNCISRQVGAVIRGPKGYVVGAGWNEVAKGKIGCGLRAIRDLQYDKEFEPIAKALMSNKQTIEELVKQLSKKYGTSLKNLEQACFCFKDEMLEKDFTAKLVKFAREDIRVGFKKMKSNKNGVEIPQELETEIIAAQEKMLRKWIEKTKLHQLKYCLALHAEENAIIQSAKIGGTGIIDAIIYTTDQPCSLCAKKIQQSGIRKVVYTEPYPASLPQVFLKEVKTIQFEGIKPRAYVRLFMPHHDQKEWQKLEKENLTPIFWVK
jgi:deoxycytidylate deaminase